MRDDMIDRNRPRATPRRILALLVVVTTLSGGLARDVSVVHAAEQTRDQAEQARLAKLCGRLLGPERAAAVRVLSEQPDRWLAAYLKHGARLEPWQRRAFVLAGEHLGAVRARRLVRRVWLDEGDGGVLEAAARLAARVGERTVLRELAASERESDRLLAIRSLGTRPEATALVLQLLRSDASPRVRIEAARVLGRRPLPEVAQALFDLACSDPVARVREQAVRSLRRVLSRLPAAGLGGRALELARRGGMDESVAELLPDLLQGQDLGRVQPLLESPQPALRAAAVRYLAVRANESDPFERELIERAVLSRLSDPDRTVQRSAIRAVGRLRLQAAVPALVERLRDGADPLGAEVVGALQAISGESFGLSYRRWRGWLERREQESSSS